jgi:site-specific DNA recombinase
MWERLALIGASMAGTIFRYGTDPGPCWEGTLRRSLVNRGPRICDNRQIQGKFIEVAVWAQVCKPLRNPERLDNSVSRSCKLFPRLKIPEILAAQLKKLQRSMERLIDGYSEGVIEKEQFASRMSRTKERIAELKARIRTSADSGDPAHDFRLFVEHYRKLATHLGSDMEDAV